MDTCAACCCCSIRHTYVLEDPFDDPPQLAELVPDASPPPVFEQVRLEMAEVCHVIHVMPVMIHVMPVVHG